jgi:cellobiose-specific phosphotransferase system component IIA
MTKDEALKLALEALEVATTPLAKDRQEVLRARDAIREALAQQPEPIEAKATGEQA